MKKIRIFLAMSAMLLAIGGAFASNLFFQTYYEYQPENGCIARSVDFTCVQSPVGAICATTSAPTIQLKLESTGTCGASLYKQ